MAKKFMLWNVTLILNLIFSSCANPFVCPNICICKWKSGKQTAECVGQGLSAIPSDMNTETQVIDLSRNHFDTIRSREFQKKGLANLQKIFLSDSGVSSVASDAFFQLSNLVELDLSGNELTKIPSEPLGDTLNLRRLQLAQNPIKYVSGNCFPMLLKLTFLDLGNCEIEVIHPEAFRGLENLKTLKIEGNQLITIPVNALEYLTGLTNLHLHNNPWNCDCRIREVRKWMFDQNIPLAVPPHCEYPEQTKLATWDVLSLDDFACSPSISPPRTTKISVTVGHNASLECRVESTPKSIIYWEVGGKSVTNMSFDPEYRGKYTIEVEGVHASATQSSRLTISNVVETDADVYTCVAENKAGNSSINFTVATVIPYPEEGVWGSTQITIVTITSVIIIGVALGVISLFIFHSAAATAGGKMSRFNLFRHFRKKKTETVEMTDTVVQKEEMELKAADKPPRQETGSSGYGSDQLTPDLVSKIVETNHGTSLSTSTVACGHPDVDNSSLNESYSLVGEQWNGGRAKPPRYDDSAARNVYSEIYPNPCFGKDDPQCFTMPSSSTLRNADRYIPQNDRVRTLRAGIECSGPIAVAEVARDDLCCCSGGSWKRSPMAVSSSASHYSLATKTRFSPDEGYAEEGLEGTEV